MEVKVKKCELNFKNTREKIVMEVTFQKTNEAVDIRDFLCMAMRENPHLRIEFSKGEYRVTDKYTPSSTNACAILELLPAILQTFRTFNGQAKDQVPDGDSKPNDIDIKKEKEKGNLGGKDQGSQTHEEDKEVQKVLAKQNFENRAHNSPTDSEIDEKTKETTGKTDEEAVNRANTGTSNCAFTLQNRKADESDSKAEVWKQRKAEAWKQEDSHGFNAPQGEEIEMISLLYQGNDNNSQTAIGSSHKGQPTATEEMAGKEIQTEENTSSLVSLGVKIKTDESRSDKDGEIPKQDPNSSRFEEAQQGGEKEDKTGTRLEMEISDTINTPDENIHTPKSGYSQSQGTGPMQTDKNVGITKSQTTSGEASESENEAAKCARDQEPAVARTEGPKLSCSTGHQMKEKAGKSEDIEATDQSVSATRSSQEHGQGSISGTSREKDQKPLMEKEEDSSLSANAQGLKKTKNDDTKPKEK